MTARSNSTGPFWVVVRVTLLATMLMALASHAETPDNHRLITTPSATSEVSVVLGKQIVRRMYGRCGLEVSYLDAPAARAVFMAESGQSDGELARIPMAVQDNAPLLPLDLPMDEAQLVPLHFGDTTVNTAGDLNGMEVGFLHGYRMIASILPEGVTPLATNDTFQLVALLEHRRIDVGLTLLWDARAAKLRNPDLVIGKPLLTAPIYHWVHESRRADIPCLSEAQTELQRSGEYDRIIEEALGPVDKDNRPRQIRGQ